MDALAARNRRVLFNQYTELTLDGFPLTAQHIERDVKKMFATNFKAYYDLPPPPPPPGGIETTCDREGAEQHQPNPPPPSPPVQ